MKKYFYEKGIVQELFLAIMYCGEEKIPLPDWIVEAFSKSVRKYINWDVKTLDEAFGTKRPKEMRFDKLQKRIKLMWPVCERLRELINEDYRKDDNTYSLFGDEFGIGKELVKEFKKEFEKTQPDFFKRL